MAACGGVVFLLEPLALPPYTGSLSGELPLYADGYIRSLQRRYRGFVLRGDDENDLWHGNTNHVCLTQLQSASLVVTYY